MTNRAKLRLKNYAFVLLGTIAILVVGGGGVWFAFTHFLGFQLLGVLIVEIAIAGMAVQVLRWFRYPGLLRGRSTEKLLISLLCTGGFVVFLLPVYVFLGMIPIAGHLAARTIPFDRWAYQLGLRFRHELFERVEISTTAPEKYLPGAIGWISSIRLTDTLNETKFWESPSGSVIYRVLYEDDHEVEVPEPFII